MDVLVTGATGVVGVPTVGALLRRDHTVRVYARHASDQVGAWPGGVTPYDGSVGDAEALTRSLAGCRAVVHLAGIVTEHGADTFDAVNVEGTRRVLEAATAAGVQRVVYVSSLGADRGKSAYHRSKRQAEELTRLFPGEWVILRPGNVYGPGDEVISLLLKMVRTLPAVPAIDGGEHQFQPIWVDDLAAVIASCVDRDDIVGRVLSLAGPDLTSMNDLIARLSALTDRKPLRVPVPGFASILGARAAGLLGLHAPLDSGQITMLEEGNFIREPADNALASVFAIEPTSLDAGLRRLADTSPEQLPDSGVGSLVRRHVWADIVGSDMHADALFERFRARFATITPWHVDVGAEPGTPSEPRLGATLTMHLPMRGNVQVRVVELGSSSVTLATLDGHPLAGLVRFRVESVGEGTLRFHVEVHDRASNIVDWLVMATVGGAVQLATWRTTVEHLVNESGGESPGGVHDDTVHFRGDEAKRVEAWARSLVEARQRAVNENAVTETVSGLGR